MNQRDIFMSKDLDLVLDAFQAIHSATKEVYENLVLVDMGLIPLYISSMTSDSQLLAYRKVRNHLIDTNAISSNELADMVAFLRWSNE